MFLRECKPVYEKYQKIFFKKTKEKFKQEHPEVARYEKAVDYLAKHPDDKDKTKNELQQEQETLLSEIAELKVPLTEVQEDRPQGHHKAHRLPQGKHRLKRYGHEVSASLSGRNLRAYQ